MSTIFPDYIAVKVKDLQPGSLFFLSPRVQDSFFPYLLISQTIIHGSEECFVLSLTLGNSVSKIPDHLGNSDAYSLKNDWRFKLKDIVPTGAERSPRNVRIGLISVCEDGRFIRGVESWQGYGGSVTVDIDQMCAREFSPQKSQQCFYAEWVIEARSGPAADWELLFDPAEYIADRN